MLSALLLIFPLLAVPAVVKGRLYASPLPFLALLATLAALLGIFHRLQAQQIVLALLSATLCVSILHLQFRLPNASPSMLILPGLFLVCATLLSIAPHHAHMAPFLSLAFILTTISTSVYIFLSRDSTSTAAPRAILPPEYIEKPPGTLFLNSVICRSDPESLVIATPTPSQNYWLCFFTLILTQLTYAAVCAFTIPAARLSPPSRPLVPLIINHPLPDRVDVFWILEETFLLMSLLCVLAAYYCRKPISPPSPSFRSSIRVHTAGIRLSSALAASAPTPSYFPSPDSDRSAPQPPAAGDGLTTKVIHIKSMGHAATCTSFVPKLPPRPKSVHHVQRRFKQQQEQYKNWSASWACPSTHTHSIYAHDLDDDDDDVKRGGTLGWTDLEDPFAPPPPLPPPPPPSPPHSPAPSITLSARSKKNVTFNINASAYRVVRKHHHQQQMNQISRPGKRMNAWGRLTLPLPLASLPLSPSSGSAYSHSSGATGCARKTRKKKKGLGDGSLPLFKARGRTNEVREPSMGMAEIEDALIAQRLLVQLGGGGMKNDK